MGSPEANLGSPEANLGSPEANLGSSEANLGSPEANLGTPEANSGSPAKSWTYSFWVNKPSKSCDEAVDEPFQHTIRCRAFKSLGFSMIKQLSNKFSATFELHVFSCKKQSFKRLHRKHLTSHSSMTIIKYMAHEPLNYFAQLISCHIRFFSIFLLDIFSFKNNSSRYCNEALDELFHYTYNNI